MSPSISSIENNLNLSYFFQICPNFEAIFRNYKCQIYLYNIWVEMSVFLRRLTSTLECMRSGFTVYGSRFRNRKTKTPKKECMRKNHDFRFAASYAIEVLLGLKLCWYNQVYRLDCRYRTFFHWAFVVCNENCNFLAVICYFSLVLLLARILYLNINA